MIISDNETKLDMLNNYPIASTIVSLIKKNDGIPISIGIHGDWGAGKSSVLEMIESDFLSEEKYLCVKFNGWKHQGFEDAKIALIESIVSELVSEKSLSGRAKEKVEQIWKNVNWMKAARAAGSVAVSVATGIPPVALIKDGLEKIGGTITDEQKRNTMIDGIFSQLTASDQSVSKEFNEFSKTFQELLATSNYDKVVVLIDDLDRCLPNVIIETLEAVRLFMFEESTAFVIAADEIMVEYAVKKHFPVYDSGISGNEFARQYLEKLIQIPFRIPILGESESKNYIMLLLISSTIRNEDRFNELIEFTLEKNKRPWEHNELSLGELTERLSDSYDDVSEQIQIGRAISTTLAKGTIGNPRQMKRFINTLLLRYEIAKSRGIDSDIDIKVLAKLMLAERFFPDVYKKIASTLNLNGTSEVLTQLDKQVKDTKKGEKKASKQVKSKSETGTEEDEMLAKSLEEWNSISPDISKIDLRPYFFISREKNNWETSLMKSSDSIRLILPVLKDGNKMAIAGIKETLLAISSEDRNYLFRVLSEEFKVADSYTSKPPAMLGLQELTKEFADLQSNMIELITSIPPEEIGVWAVSGWNGIFTDDYFKQYMLFVEKIAEVGKGAAKSAAQAQIKRLNGGN